MYLCYKQEAIPLQIISQKIELVLCYTYGQFGLYPFVCPYLFPPVDDDVSYVYHVGRLIFVRIQLDPLASYSSEQVHSSPPFYYFNQKNAPNLSNFENKNKIKKIRYFLDAERLFIALAI